VEEPVDKATKTQVIQELRDSLGPSPVAILCDFRGVKVEQVNRLRAEFHKSGVQYRVVKNTLTKLALEGTAMAKALDPYLVGPTAVAFHQDDPIAPAKILVKMLKEIPTLTVKGGYLDGQAIDAAGVERLATMPGKDELRAQLLATFNAPATSLVRVLS
jgi:large subunit ribosomal protein L10